MAMDQVTAEVVTALGCAGVGSVLLKGAAVAQWLYPEGGRSYGDTDLLVDPARFPAAAAVLGQLGFRPLRRLRSPAQVFYRPRDDGEAPDAVDLHRTLHLARVAPETVWATLTADTMEMTVGGTKVAAPGLPGRAFHVALHAAQHGFAYAKGMEDLRRALAVVPLDGWRQAADLARRLGAEDCLAAGLRLLPEGRAVAADLGLTEDVRLVVRMRCRSVAGAGTLEAWADARTVGEKVAVVRDVIFRPVAVRSASSPSRLRIQIRVPAAVRRRRLVAEVRPGVRRADRLGR
jgi:hypothetical protein